MWQTRVINRIFTGINGDTTAVPPTGYYEYCTHTFDWQIAAGYYEVVLDSYVCRRGTTGSTYILELELDNIRCDGGDPVRLYSFQDINACDVNFGIHYIGGRTMVNLYEIGRLLFDIETGKYLPRELLSTGDIDDLGVVSGAFTQVLTLVFKLRKID